MGDFPEVFYWKGSVGVIKFLFKISIKENIVEYLSGGDDEMNYHIQYQDKTFKLNIYGCEKIKINGDAWFAKEQIGFFFEVYNKIKNATN
tara:strand:+ start:166 stop:435 length:270 start_codon:yes stop_codon:yes gene_type:complete